MAAPVSKAQIKMIRSLFSKISADDATYREWLYYTFFKDDIGEKRTSTSQLTKAEGHIAISLLMQTVNPSTSSNDTRGQGQTPRPRYFGTGLGWALTQTQANKIAVLESQLGWADNPLRLEGFIERQIGKRKKVEWLKNREASKVITGLQKLLEKSE